MIITSNKINKIFFATLVIFPLFMILLLSVSVYGNEQNIKTYYYDNSAPKTKYNRNECHVAHCYIYDIDYKKCLIYGYDTLDINHETFFVLYDIDDLHIGECLNLLMDKQNNIIKWNMYALNYNTQNPTYIYTDIQ